MVTSLKKNFSILIYEKEKLLNSILYYQISNHNNFKVSVKDNKLEMFEVLNKKKFDTCIINLNLLNEDLKKFYDMFENNNNHNNIIGYYEHDFENSFFAKDKIFLLKKPFKLISLLNHLDNIKRNDTLDNTNKYLMNHIIFSPSKKIISNIETGITERLTEKENNLLVYFYNKKNIELLKKDLLTNIWGVSNEINTHTLETHIYRLKQKLFKLDSNLSFSLVNQNGLYCLKYRDKV